jgi:hypothetical protein
MGWDSWRGQEEKQKRGVRPVNTEEEIAPDHSTRKKGWGVGVAHRGSDVRFEEVRGETADMKLGKRQTTPTPTPRLAAPRRAALTPSIQHSIPE